MLDDLAVTYKTALGDSLKIKQGARSLLMYLKSIGKKTVVITEGPQDAQEWTLTELGISDQVDYLATTNFFGVSKVDGLFGKVLKELEIEAADLVYVGDSWNHDMLPTRDCGIFAVHYSEKENSGFDGNELRICSLNELEHILNV